MKIGVGGKKISSLPVGTKVRASNTKYNGATIGFVVGHQASGRTKLITEKIITLKCFDAKEASNPDSSRKNYGNNRYSQSNIDQWLNSSTSAEAWYSAQHTYDAPPNNANVWSGYNEYDAEAGFLSFFEESFRNAILDSTIRVAKNTITDGDGYEDITRKVYLLSNTEVGLANENNIEEGTKWDLFSNDDSSRLAYPTAEAVSTSEYTNSSLNVSSSWYWWLRTPRADSSSNVRFVYANGGFSDNTAYSSHRGVRPALELPNDITVSETPDEDGYYTISFNVNCPVKTNKWGKDNVWRNIKEIKSGVSNAWRSVWKRIAELIRTFTTKADFDTCTLTDTTATAAGDVELEAAQTTTQNWALAVNGGVIHYYSIGSSWDKLIDGVKGGSENVNYGGTVQADGTSHWLVIKTDKKIKTSRIDWYNDGQYGVKSIEIRCSNDNFSSDDRIIGTFSNLSLANPIVVNTLTFDEVEAQYFKFTFLSVNNTRWTQVNEVEIIGTCMFYLPSGTAESPAIDLSPAISAQTSEIAWNGTTPTDTTLTMQTALSTDGGTNYGEWQTATSGGEIVPHGTNLANARLKWKATLGTNDGAVTPKLHDVTVKVNENTTAQVTFTPNINRIILMDENRTILGEGDDGWDTPPNKILHNCIIGKTYIINCQSAYSIKVNGETVLCAGTIYDRVPYVKIVSRAANEDKTVDVVFKITSSFSPIEFFIDSGIIVN
ncbi:MAG: DUF6273 domain-containing protein [Eubacteriales bacterium]|nr:DUF6273 domain-containing protein [Eubacteriales bacterium]